VPELLDRLAARVRKRHKHLREDEPEDLHRLRKAMKTLRYGTEDLAALGYRKAAVRYLRRIKTVLGSLGAINDAAVTVCRIAELGPEAGTPLGTAADAVLIWNAKRRRKALRAFATDWRKFADAEPFWA
jgi:CHAD domain-containing protein